MDTVMTLEAGNYVAPSGDMVVIESRLEEAVLGTVTHNPMSVVPLPTVLGTHETKISVVNQGSLETAKEMVDRGLLPAILNFASAKNPGGGFMNGARAQEESLARVSGLYSCIVGNEMYRHHARNGSALYSHYVIYSPRVPVFKDSQGRYLEEPWMVDIITSPSPNAGAYRRNPAGGGSPDEAVQRVYRARAEKVLATAASMEADSLVLGAWGCGVFGCDPDMAADAFHGLLTGKFRGVFQEVVFAILEGGPIEILGDTFRGHLFP